MVRKRVIVHGRVQGVFFRDTTRRTAGSRGVHPPQKTLVVGFIANGPINPTTVGLGWLCA